MILYVYLLIGNIDLDALSPKRLRKRYICSEHFEASMFMNSKAEKLKLIRNATPKKYAESSDDGNIYYLCSF